MQRDARPDISTNQSLDKTPVLAPPSNTQSKTLLFIMSELFVISFSIFIGIQIGKNQNPNQQPTTAKPTASLPPTNSTIITGVIRTSGLSDDEKQTLGLSEVKYQLTDINKDIKPDIYGYYLISTDKNLETYLGKCVQITGVEPTEWKNKNKADSYFRTAIVLDSINPTGSTNCNPYSVTPKENIAGVEKFTLQGIVTNSNRPAPDIKYDYLIKLSKPFIDEDGTSGSPQQINLVEAIPDTNNVWIELTNNINQEVEIQGYMEWGYSESKYFRITSIKKL